MSNKNSFTGWIDSLPLWVKFIFALPVLDGIFYGIYRILKGKVVAGIIWIFVGATIGWIADIVCLALYKKVTLFV
ncbi:MAG: hypothetical protein RR334_01200 [Clostridia bacterium]